MAGLLDPSNRQALGMGLLNAGADMAQGGNRSLLGGLGQGLQGFGQGYLGIQDRQRQQQLYDLQLRGMQREETQAEGAAASREQMQQAVQDAIRRGAIPQEIAPQIELLNQSDPEKAMQAALDWSMKQEELANKAPWTGAIKGPDGQWIMDPAYLQGQKDIRAAGRTSNTINVGPSGIDYGDPEPGLAWARSPDGSVRLDERGAPIAIPYQGGKPYNAMVAAEKAGEVATEQTTRSGNVVLTDIARARDKIVNAPWYAPTTGLVGDVLKDVGGTPAADVKALTDTVRANIGFDRLQQMRDSSPTGGALGQVTEKEQKLLQAVLGNLEQSQSEEQLLENLDRLERIYTDVMRKAAAYPNAAEYGFDGGGAQAVDNPYSDMTDEQILEELRKGGYIE